MAKKRPTNPISPLMSSAVSVSGASVCSKATSQGGSSKLAKQSAKEMKKKWVSRLARRIVLPRARENNVSRTIVKLVHQTGKSKQAKPCRRKSCGALPNPDLWGDYESKISKDGKVSSKPIGDVCGGCVLTYTSGGFEVIGELEEVLDRCSTDEDFNQRFIIADRRRRGNERVHHIQAQVGKKFSEGLDMAIPMVGLTPTEFAEWKGFSHEAVGRKLKDLPHPNHSSFKGTIVRDDGTLGDNGVKYRLWRRIEVSLEHLVLPRQEHIMEDQAWDLFDELVAPLKDEDPEV
jgi:hypothetical protein